MSAVPNSQQRAAIDARGSTFVSAGAGKATGHRLKPVTGSIRPAARGATGFSRSPVWAARGVTGFSRSPVWAGGAA